MTVGISRDTGERSSNSRESCNITHNVYEDVYDETNQPRDSNATLTITATPAHQSSQRRALDWTSVESLALHNSWQVGSKQTTVT